MNFSCGNYSSEEAIQERKVYQEIRYVIQFDLILSQDRLAVKLRFDIESLGKGFLDNYTCNFRPVYSATKLLFHFM